METHGRPPGNALRLGEILAGFRGRLEPVPVPLPYRLTAAAILLALVLLPLLYLLLAAAVTAATVLYPVFFWPTAPTLRAVRIAAFLLVASPILAAVLLPFLVGTLSSRPRPALPALPVSPEREPLLHAFVERVSQAMGAPPPGEIRLDIRPYAWAELVLKTAVLFSSRRRVLTIGLPLVEVLSLQDLAGVLAHELAHFTQRGGTGLIWALRLLSICLGRLAAAPNALVERLARTAGSRHRADRLVARGALGLLRLCRWPPLAMAEAARAAALALRRQMEYHADRCEVRLAGRRNLGNVLRAISSLKAAEAICLKELSWLSEGTGEMAGDLPGLIAARYRGLEAALAGMAEEHIAAGRTEAWNTHPSDRDRLARVAGEPEEGIFSSCLPAAALFVDLPARRAEATRLIYSTFVGDGFEKAPLLSTEAVLRRLAERRAP